jgi:hypothetical protein
MLHETLPRLTLQSRRPPVTGVFLTLPIFGDASDGPLANQPVRVLMVPGQSVTLGRNAYPGLGSGDTKCVV